MKKIFLSPFIISFFCSFQQISLPQAVKESFNRIFPEVTTNEWSYENFLYVSSFKINDKKASAKFLKDGVWMETEIELLISELPDKVLTAFNTNFGSKINCAGKIERSNSKVVYFVETDQDKSKMYIVFTADGKQIELSIKNGNTERK